MTEQPDLFHPSCAGQFYTQRDLFPEHNDCPLSCNECGAQLVETDSSYFACPAGHGGLKMSQPEPEGCGRWFDEPFDDVA